MDKFKPSEEILTLINYRQIQFINADYDDEGIHVYQAYKDEIADFALENQYFGGPHWGDRMTWIKPSFAWMLYRCGYGRKHNQNRVLRIKLSHEIFAEILGKCNLTVHLKIESSKNRKETEHEDDTQNKYENLSISGDKSSDKFDKPTPSSGRIQWDPERDLYSTEPMKHEPGKIKNTRAIQIGISGGIRDLYVNNIIKIEEVTDYANKIGEIHKLKNDQKISEEITEHFINVESQREFSVNERPYFPILCEKEVLERLGLIPGEEANLLKKLGNGKVQCY